MTMPQKMDHISTWMPLLQLRQQAPDFDSLGTGLVLRKATLRLLIVYSCTATTPLKGNRENEGNRRALQMMLIHRQQPWLVIIGAELGST